MNKKNITPNLVEPIERFPVGRLPSMLAELSDERLSNLYVLPSPRSVEREDEDRGGDIGYDSDVDDYGYGYLDWDEMTEEEKAEIYAEAERDAALREWIEGMGDYLDPYSDIEWLNETGTYKRDY